MKSVGNRCPHGLKGWQGKERLVSLLVLVLFVFGLQSTNAKGPAAPGKDIDFNPYMALVQQQIKTHWFPPKGNESKQVMVIFKIHSVGKLSDLRIDRSSGVQTADQAALNAVESAAPFPALPSGAPENVDIQFKFDYNVFRSGKHINTMASVVSIDQWRQGEESRLKLDLARAESSKGSDGLRVASALANLAGFYKNIGNWEGAQAHYDRALKLREAAPGSQNPLVATTLVEMGEADYLQGKYAEAEPLFQRAIAIEESPDMHDNATLANALEKYAKVLYKTSRVPEADKLYSRISQLRAGTARRN